MENPLAVKNPEFHCTYGGVMGLESSVSISRPESGNKSSRVNNLLFHTVNTGGYPMKIAVKFDGEKEWRHVEEIAAISIQIFGDYEATDLVAYFQHVGLMTLPVYGRFESEE